MSLLSSEVHTALAELLQKLASPDNQARTLAEEQLNNEWFIKQPDVLLVGLVEQIQLSQEPSVGRVRKDSVLKHSPLIWPCPCVDPLFCSSLIPQNVNKDEEDDRRGPGVQRAIFIAANTAKIGHKTKVAGLSAKRGAPTSEA